MEKNLRVRKSDGLPYGSPRVNVPQDKGTPPPVKEENKEEEQQQPAPEMGKLMVMIPKVEQSIKLCITLDQIGIKDANNELVDPNNNILHKVSVTVTGEMDIALICGRIATNLFGFYRSLQGNKGIKRGVGFNVNMEVEDETKTEKGSIRIDTVTKLRMSQPANIAFAIAGSFINYFEKDNAANLLTGEFGVSAQTANLIDRLKLDEVLKIAPTHVVSDAINQKRLTINNNVKEIKKYLQN